MKHYRISLLIFSLLLLMTSCEELTQNKLFERHSDNGMAITSVEFKDNNRKIIVMANSQSDMGGLAPDDSTQVRVRVNEMNSRFIPTINYYQPTLDSVIDVGVEEIKETGLVMTVLVDLTQTSALINTQREIVKYVYSAFCRDNLMLAFMLPHGEVTSPLKATPYVINNYIVSGSPLLNVSDTEGTDTLANRAYLYRSLYETLQAIVAPKDSILERAPLRSLMVLTDGVIYDDITNMPLDPDHFNVQEKLIRLSRNLGSNITVSSVFLTNLSQDDTGNMDNNLIHMVCLNSGGCCYSKFDWNKMETELLDHFGLDISEYKFVLSNPEKKLYFGNTRYMQISLYAAATDSLLAMSSEPFHVGRLFHPAYVGDVLPWASLTMRGVFLALILILVLYLILQFIVPYVNYLLFRKKNVITYTGNNMSVNGIIVPQNCYLCKAPFKAGDKIVAACEHVMHEECWHENGDHCPEYGAHCTTGSHFYDRHNLFNPRNATFYLKWILLAQIPIIISWVYGIVFYQGILHNIIYAAFKTIPAYAEEMGYMNTPNFSITNYICSWELGLPLLTHTLAPLLTLIFATITTWHYRLGIRVLYIVLRALAVYVITFVVAVIETMTLLYLNIYDGSFIADWLPLATLIFSVCWFSTVGTRLKVPVMHIFKCSIVAALLLAVASQFMLGMQVCNDALYLIIIAILFSIIIIGIIAQDMPSGIHKMLHVTGPVKEMDIALYKWLRQSPDAVVTIGRSIDCSLQLSWDIQSDIAPIQARIYMKGDQPLVEKLDGSVLYNGEELRQNKPCALYHGDMIQIGLTQLRFLEK